MDNDNAEASVIIDETVDEYFLLIELRGLCYYRLQLAKKQIAKLPAEADLPPKIKKELSNIRKELTEIAKALMSQKIYYSRLNPQLQSEEECLALLQEHISD